MTEPPTMLVSIDPPMRDWRVTARNGRTQPVIATGHQPFFWHPGILAKDLAADAFAQSLGGSAMHIVVEHNALDPLAIDVPIRRGDAMHAHRVVLDQRPGSGAMPPNRIGPLDPDAVHHAVTSASLGLRDLDNAREQLNAALDPILLAYADAGDHPHLAAQTTAVLGALKRPYLHADMQTLPTSELVMPAFRDRLLADPVGCVASYNRAALAYPQAGIRPLYAGRDVVEVPLWAQGEGVCTPVFVDLGDSRKPLLFTQGQDLDLTGPDALRSLRPRAATLSAIMRSERCDLFIHGIGGGIYEQVTERWWQDWVGEPLAPLAVVSADAYLPLDAPLATRDELDRAVWFSHHLPHNVERYAEAQDDAQDALVQEKRDLLDRMNDDRNKRRRSKAFRRIHAINAELRRRHPRALIDANQQLGRARVGVRNAALARRRDWSFALYPQESLETLREEIRQALAGAR